MKQRLHIFISMAMAVLALQPQAVRAQSRPATGDGASDNPFVVTTAEELEWYADYVNGDSGDDMPHTTACARLDADIDLRSVCGADKGKNVEA